MMSVNWHAFLLSHAELVKRLLDVTNELKCELLQAIYERIFSSVVSSINDVIDVKAKFRYGTIIGVLDIYGFEIFNQNR